MSSVSSRDSSGKLEWRMPKPSTPAFRLLEQILDGRHQSWATYTIKERDSRVPLIFPQDEIDRCILELEQDELDRALFVSCVHGDLEIAQAIWQRRGPFDITYEVGSAYQIFINDEPTTSGTKAQHILTNIRSRQELSKLMEWMPTVGLGFMTGVGTDTAFMLQAYRIDEPIRQVAWPAIFGGEIPVLQTGVVECPELLLALQQKASSSAYPHAYKEILCWVEESMASELFSSQVRFESQQYLRLKPSFSKLHDPRRDVPLCEITEKQLEDVSRRTLIDGVDVDSPAAWEYDALQLRAVPVSSDDPKDNIVLGYQANIPLQHGFDFKPGYVLCRTTIDMLANFQVGQVDQSNLQQAREFVADYCPIDLMMQNAKQENPFHALWKRKSLGMSFSNKGQYHDFKDFCMAYGNESPLQPYMQRAISPALFEFFRNVHCTVNIDAQSLLALHQGLGIDNTGFSVSLDVYDLPSFVEAGFRFSNESKIVKYTREIDGKGYTHSISSGDTDVILEMEDPFMHTGDHKNTPQAWLVADSRYGNALRLGLWTGEKEAPDDLYQAVAVAGRKRKWLHNKYEKSVLAMIDLAGMEACAGVAKTTPQWMFLSEHFGREAMTPFLKTATREARGKILANELGL
jgi:hypothetical protein